MENASKALIIAGAILLSILIIALGIYVFNMARGVTNTSILSETEVSTFNSQFTDYRGKIPGSGVEALLEKCITNAIQNANDAQRLPDVYALGTGLDNTVITSKPGNNNETNVAGFSTLKSKIAPRHYYFVDFAYDNTSGCIKGIAIGYNEENKNTALNNCANVNVE